MVNINYDVMKQVCLAPSEEFTKLKGAKVIPTPTNGLLIHIDNGSNVLAVAHLDSVVTKAKHFYKITILGETFVFNAQLDDRLGVYTILSLLPSLGIKTDILLTDDEEIGKSTAQYFKPEKQYNWIVEFDRTGTDLVHYQYDGKFIRKRWDKAGFKKITHGLNTDICYMEGLGCKAFNIGVGYYDYHSAWAKVDITEYLEQIEKFQLFYVMYKDLHFRHEPKPYQEKTYATTYYGRGSDWGDDVPPFTTGKKALPAPQNGIWRPHTKKNVKLNDLLCANPECLRRLITMDKESKFEGFCLMCDPILFGCLGCDRVFHIKYMRGDNLCPECHNEWEFSPSQFMVLRACKSCHTNPLTLYEYRHNELCVHCDRIVNGLCDAVG